MESGGLEVTDSAREGLAQGMNSGSSPPRLLRQSLSVYPRGKNVLRAGLWNRVETPGQSSEPWILDLGTSKLICRGTCQCHKDLGEEGQRVQDTGGLGKGPNQNARPAHGCGQ